jgi:DNA-binding CsgD family transcriptional regulator
MNESGLRSSDPEGLLDKVPVGLLWHDCRGRILAANAWLHGVLGYGPGELRGESLWNVVRIPGQRELVVRTYEALVPSAPDASLLLVCTHARGAPLALHVDLRGEFDEDGAPRAFAWAMRMPEPIAAGVASSLEALARATARLERLVDSTSSPALGSAPPAHEANGAAGELSRLSPRERQVAELLLEGESPSSMAARLNVSEHTVRNHLKGIYRRLGVHSKDELLLRLFKKQR